MNLVSRCLRNLGPRTVQLMQKRHRLILGQGYKDGFKEIPNTGFAPKHAKAYADITTPRPKLAGVEQFNNNIFLTFVVLLTLGFSYAILILPNKRGSVFLKSHRPLIEADERYAEYLEKYYYDELKNLMDDEAIISTSAKKL